MKKRLLLLGFTLNFVSPCYGMNLDQASKTRLEIFDKSIENKSWDFVAIAFTGSESNLRPHYEKRLLDQTSDYLNVILPGKAGLFESLFDEYFIATDSNRDYFKTLLQKLILNGLDYKVQKQGEYVYKYYGNMHLEARAKMFWAMFDELMLANPAEQAELSKGFEAEMAARQGQQHVPNIRQNRQNVQVQVTPPRVPIQQTVQVQQKPIDDGTPASKAKAVFNKKLSATGIYFIFGCAVIALGYQVYKLYAEDKTDDDEEIDENQQDQHEAGEQETIQTQGQF